MKKTIKRKRKSTPSRMRLTSYERSLETATLRLEKAQAERLGCMLQLQALNQEIPYLEGIIKALAPPTREVSQEDAIPGAFSEERAAALKDVPTHLQKFIPPLMGRTMTRAVSIEHLPPDKPVSTTPNPPNPSAEDEFLPEPNGAEVLE